MTKIRVGIAEIRAKTYSLLLLSSLLLLLVRDFIYRSAVAGVPSVASTSTVGKILAVVACP
jgi:hypothetical protein